MLSPAPAVPGLFLVGVVAATLATLAMDVAMARLPEGTTSPFVAAGVLTETPPADAPARLASVVHYIAGLLTGPLFVWLLLAAASVLDGVFLPAALAATVLYVLMVAFFAVVVLPRSLVATDRVSSVRRDWAAVAAVYLVVLVPVVTGAASAL
jgi:hypothetical protein